MKSQILLVVGEIFDGQIAIEHIAANHHPVDFGQLNNRLAGVFIFNNGLEPGRLRAIIIVFFNFEALPVQSVQRQLQLLLRKYHSAVSHRQDLPAVGQIDRRKNYQRLRVPVVAVVEFTESSFCNGSAFGG